MSVKKKLILMGICLAIILVVLTVNVYKKIRKGNASESVNSVVTENVMTRAEAYRLLSYLEYDRKERKAIPTGIEYLKKNMSGWYDTYVNAVWKMGLIEGKVTVSPQKALTYGACKELIDKLIIDHPEYQTIYAKLSFDFIKAEKAMQTKDFLELYKAILRIPNENTKVKEMTLFVLGKEVSKEEGDRIITDQGKFYYDQTKNYEDFMGQESKLPGQAKNNTSHSKRLSVDQFVDKGMKALVCGQDIIYISSETTEKIILHNVWIIEGKENKVDTFAGGIEKTFQTKFPLSDGIEKVVGDIAVENQKVVQVSVKPDIIHGKVLLASDKFIEVEGYGKLPLEEGFCIYKIFGGLSIEPTSSILVGYKTTDFVVSQGKISAALIKENMKAENIRVLLKTSDYKDIFHDKVKFSVNTDFTLKSKDKETSYKAGDTVTIEPGDKLLSEGRIKVIPKSENGRIQILSIKRDCGNPKYRGSLEISEGDHGLLLVNELSLEEYLYAVIPSEMPTYYGIEALKVQAVCARSYAYRQLLANGLNSYGAHVDDSAAYQVYNNIAENEDSIMAVKDTFGKVIKYNGEVIPAYYFSTSCGHTTDAVSVWTNTKDEPYLTGKLMEKKEDGKEVTAQEKKTAIYEDLTKEDNFRAFIRDTEFPTYENDFGWYRWKTSMSAENIKKVIDGNLLSRYQANPEFILTLTSKAKNKTDFESIPVDTVGNIVDITVLKRGSGGIVTELLIKGTKNTVKVINEYNIRVLLAPVYDSIEKKDMSRADNLSMLPSAFFIIDRKEKAGNLAGFELTGGGYGHGVGMSQNAVKGMADADMKYEAIVKYFYKETQLGYVYQ